MADSRPARTATLFVLDLLGYVLVVDFFVFCIAAVVGLLTGGQWVVVEEVMFVTGLLLFGYATMSLWPTSIEDEESTRMDDPAPAGRIQRTVDALLLLADTPSLRLPENVKLFLASIVVVFTAFLVERLLIV